MDHVEIKGRRPGKAVLLSPRAWTKVLETASKGVKLPTYSGIVGGKSSLFGMMTEYISIDRGDPPSQKKKETFNSLPSPSHAHKSPKRHKPSTLQDHMFQSNRNTSNHSLQSTRPIMLLQHMSLAVVTPRKAPKSVLAILILAHKPATRFGGAMTT